MDDHDIVRAGLTALFAGSKTIELVGTAASAKEAVDAVRRLKPDVVLMDLRLREGSGVSACQDILAVRPATKVIFLTAYEDDLAAAAMLLGGAADYLIKDLGYHSILLAIESAAAGHPFQNRRTVTSMTTQLRAMANTPGMRSGDLSAQECRVLELVVAGKTNREIASALGLSANTVKNYLSNAFQKLHVARRMQAAALFSRRKTDPPSK
ncbi:MAG TPA: response regulator transcription factor [Verrucomicrobiae bacterium]|nr:response regulator transcription factor [Verrucomicrobiae bacterium]